MDIRLVAKMEEKSTENFGYGVSIHKLKLSAACCAVRSMVHIGNINTFKSNNYAYFPSVINYAIIF
jgi:hypothetical protein